jgi:hypothetical protein
MTDTNGRSTHEHRLAGAEAQAALEAHATPERAEIRQSAAGRVEASEVFVRQGAVGFARADRINVAMGAVGAALGRRVDVRQSLSRFAAARDTVSLEQSGALTVVANRVDVGRQSGVVFLFARNVHGNVRTLFDWRAGLAFGVGAGLVALLAGLLPRGRR